MTGQKISLVYGCSECGKTTRSDDCPVSDFIAPRGVEVTCPFCGAPVGEIVFKSREELAAALENPPTAEPKHQKILFYNARPDLRHHHPED